ncbi:glutamyl-tRNA reductase [Anaerosporomusa subterranea]|uniref:Glutamyl-tRNA reductase n=1 Tax=Anaerosporomusa subterranea TaxID=1794912 RepID=A0A154BQK7_ANASB|nr:glutamyl-tRNA reductase [Anaerosporomusa subterranea]KYZ76274.1 glutamyl-tRNA reductase [Anaerosporomusa subterranea]
MQLVVLGLNHKTAPVDIRECFAFSEEQVKKTLARWRKYPEIAECVILSTCNRTEVYAMVENTAEALPLMRDSLAKLAGSPITVSDHLFYLTDEACIRHLFRVAASLESLVVGEGQILSQVKKAYRLAKDAAMTGAVLNTLFNRTIAVGKAVRSRTRIAYSAVSVSYAAVQLAKQVLGSLSQANVLVLGAGEMSELTAKHLVENGVRTVFVSNRRFERAVQLADKFHGVAVPFENFLQSAQDADIVITSTGAPHYIVTALEVAHLMTKRRGKPIMFIDIAVPRDVEPEVEALAGVSLYNIDSLESVVESNLRSREQEAKLAEAIIETELAELLEKFRYLSFRPTLVRLSDKAETIRQRELKRALGKLPDSTPEQQRVVENMSRMLVRKLLRDPIIRIHEAAAVGREQPYLDAVTTLFKLDEIKDESPSCRKETDDEDTNNQPTCHRCAGQ